MFLSKKNRTNETITLERKVNQHSGSSRKVLLSIFVYKAYIGKVEIHIFDMTLAHKRLILSMIYLIVDIGALIVFKKL